MSGAVSGWTAKVSRPATLDIEVSKCLAALVGTVTGSTLDRVASTAAKFASFARATDATSLRTVSADLASGFVGARTSTGEIAGTALKHHRRTTLRLLFRAARRLGLADIDPTIDIELPTRTAGGCRPLTDAEVSLARDAAEWWLSSTRFSVVWALAESTARGAELGNVRAKDIDIDAQRVWLRGGTRVQPRWGRITDWGLQILARRLETVLPDELVTSMVGSAAECARISAAAAVGSVLTRAGLGAETDIKPSSVAAWAGRTVFERTGSIAETARAMGLRSLDATARAIGWDWTS